MLSVTVTEPRFTVAEKAMMLAARRERDVPRGRHGVRISEATDPAFQYQWVVEQPVRDFAQEALDDAQDAYWKQYKDTAKPASLLWRVRKAD